MVFPSLLSRRARRQRGPAAELYAAIVGQAREPIFFSDLEVPDNLDGRFEMLALHAFLVLRRIKAEGEAGADLAQAVFDVFFEDMDRSLRELGATDLGVGRRVKAMAQAFYGRIRAYDQGLEGDDAALSGALRRNIWGTVAEPSQTHVAMLACYLRRQQAALSAQPKNTLAEGRVAFLPATFETMEA